MISAAFFFSFSNTLSSAARHKRREARRSPARAGAARRSLACGAASAAEARSATHVVAMLCDVAHTRRGARREVLHPSIGTTRARARVTTDDTRVRSSTA